MQLVIFGVSKLGVNVYSLPYLPTTYVPRYGVDTHNYILLLLLPTFYICIALGHASRWGVAYTLQSVADMEGGILSVPDKM